MEGDKEPVKCHGEPLTEQEQEQQEIKLSSLLLQLQAFLDKEEVMFQNPVHHWQPGKMIQYMKWIQPIQENRKSLHSLMLEYPLWFPGFPETFLERTSYIQRITTLTTLDKERADIGAILGRLENWLNKYPEARIVPQYEKQLNKSEQYQKLGAVITETSKKKVALQKKGKQLGEEISNKKKILDELMNSGLKDEADALAVEIKQLEVQQEEIEIQCSFQIQKFNSSVHQAMKIIKVYAEKK